MKIKRKILSRIGIMVILATIVTMIIVMINFRTYGIEAATQKAEIVTDLVKNGLTSHMLNNTMDQQDRFIDNLSLIKDIESLWVIRGDVVSKQYGPPRTHVMPRDEIDKKVIKSGKREVVLDESLKNATLRVTIPYIASRSASVNCFDCHNAKHGDVLGAVSMEFDIMSVRESGLFIMIDILLISAIAIFIIILLTNRSLNPYLELFESLKRSLARAASGDFSHKLGYKISDEAGVMATEYDILLEKLERTFGKIDKNLRKFVATKNSLATDPLTDAEQIVTSLTNLYQFKKAIELDVGKEDIYERFRYVLENYHGITSFCIIEVDHQMTDAQIVLQSPDFISCVSCTSSDLNACRARRTGTDVVSDQFPHLCECFKDNEEFHICTPISVNGKVSIVIHITCDTQDDFDKAMTQIGFIKNYANEAAPVIETKRVLEILKESSLKDALTGLYNRRFLDEYVEKIKAGADRSKKKIGILMIDMDYFKMVNDTYGHDVGDIVLRDLSEVIIGNIREADLAVRYGGEEFIVLLMDIDGKKNSMAVAEKIRKCIEDKNIDIGENRHIKKSVSIGVSLFSEDSASLWQSIKFADIALYKAKMSGRNKVVRFEPAMSEDMENF